MAWLGGEGLEDGFMEKIFHRHAVPAAVGVVDGMQRLMHIADKVDEVADRFGALYEIGGLVFQDGPLLFDRPRHASFGTAGFVQLSLLLPTMNIGVIPRPFLPLVAHF